MLITEQSLVETLMAARVIRGEDADYSFLIKQCSSRINCCSARVWFAAIRPTVGPANRATTAYLAAGVKGITVEWSSNRSPRVRPCWPPASSTACPSAHSPAQPVWRRDVRPAGRAGGLRCQPARVDGLWRVDERGHL